MDGEGRRSDTGNLTVPVFVDEVPPVMSADLDRTLAWLRGDDSTDDVQPVIVGETR